MTHDEAHELLELAAVEPGGIDRLMAGDTSAAAAVAGHLAGCDACAGELERLRRSSMVLREVVGAVAPPELRARTLAFVAEVGRPRGGTGRPPEAAGVGRSPAAVEPAARRRQVLGTLGGLAAAVAIAVGATGAVLQARHDEDLRAREAALAAQEATTGALAKVASWSLRVGAAPDATMVPLSGSSEDAAATVLFSRATEELVVVAEALAPPEPGREYRCWMEVDGARTRIGQMFFGGGISYWVGPVDALDDAGRGTRFGISLVEAATDDVGGDPVLAGDL